MNKLKIIAEIANAHNGNEHELKELIEASYKSKADAVKFQWFKYDCLATPSFSWYQDYKNLFIHETVWKEAMDLAISKGLEVWIDIFDHWGLNLAKKHSEKISGIKLPSAVFQTEELVREIAKLQKPLLVGVGGWYDEEIEQTLTKLKKYTDEKIILMHGFQGYPTKVNDANLARIPYLKNKFNLDAGFADHVDASHPIAIELPVYAYFTGATVIEKHITLDRRLKRYDYYSSLGPEEFASMVKKLFDAEIVMGNIEVNSSQRAYLEYAVRSVANKDISAGEIISLDKTTFKRCNEKIALWPQELIKVLPKVAKESISKNQPIIHPLIEDPKISIVVIARLKSTRLPKKALLPIYHVPSLERCLINCLEIKNAKIVLATSHLHEDDPLEKFDLEGRVAVVRGDPDNVVERLLQAAEYTKADIVVRVTGDCPAVSPELLDYLIKEHLKSGKDFTSATEDHSDGTIGDVYTVESLRRLSKHAKRLTYTEYLPFYYLNNPNMFSVNLVELPLEYQFPQWRLTLDEKKDLTMFENLYRGLDIGREALYFRKIKEFLNENSAIGKLNHDVPAKYKDDKSFINELNKETILEDS